MGGSLSEVVEGFAAGPVSPEGGAADADEVALFGFEESDGGGFPAGDKAALFGVILDVGFHGGK